MAYANPIRDMRRGDIWIEIANPIAHVVIVSAGNKYVEFMREGGKLEVWYDVHFRARFAHIYDRAAIRAQFQMSLANLDSFHAFWCPQAKRLFARSTARAPEASYAAARGSPPLPQSAIHVGTYSNPFPADAFLGDLDAVIAKLNRKAPRDDAGTIPYAFA